MKSCVCIYVLSYIVLLAQCEECNIGKCPDPVNTIPDCDNTAIIDCVSGVVSTCPTGISIRNMLRSSKLAYDTICKDEKLHEEMRTHSECWSYAFKCASWLALNSDFTEPEECQILKKELDECKTNPPPPIACIGIHEQFLDLAYETSTCDGATIGLTFTLLILSITLLYYV